MKALITGASGMLGLNLTELLLEEGWDLTFMINPGSLRKRPWAKRLLEGDVIEARVEDFEGRLEVDVVFHLAAVMRGPTWKVNYLGTKNLLKRLSFDKFVFVSSVLALGDSLKKGAHENMPCEPRTGYERSKCEAEREVSKLEDFVIVRPGWIYGKYSINPDILNIVKSIRWGFAPILVDEKLPLALVNAKDVSAAMLHLVKKGAKGIFNVRGPRMYTMGELIDVISSIMGKKALKLKIPRFAIGLYSKAVDVARYLLLAPEDVPIDKLRDHGFSPSIDLKSGMSEALSWMKEEGIL